jgi:hypothetical protein
LEQPKGLHGKEKGSFILVVQDEGEERWKIGFLCGWENLRAYVIGQIGK